MGVASALTPTSILSGTIGTVIGGIIVRAWQRRQESKDEIEAWYRDATGIISRVQRIGYQSTEYPPTDYPTMRDKLDPLADELQDHAASAPSGIPDEHRKELLTLSSFVTGIIALSERSVNVDGLDFLELVQNHARETVGDDVTIEQVNQLIESIDTAAIADELSTEDVSVNDKAITEFLANFDDKSIENEEIQSVDEALEMPLDTLADTVDDESVWGDLVGNTMRRYARLFLIEIAEDVF